MCLVYPTEVEYNCRLQGVSNFVILLFMIEQFKIISFTGMMKLQMEKMKGMYYKRFFNKRLYM